MADQASRLAFGVHNYSRTYLLTYQIEGVETVEFEFKLCCPQGSIDGVVGSNSSNRHSHSLCRLNEHRRTEVAAAEIACDNSTTLA